VLRQGYEIFFAAFPDAHMRIDDLLADRDKVVARYTWSGSHRGTYLGREATGKHVTGTGIGIYRVAEGKIAERWHEWNPFAVMQQLQASPTQQVVAGAVVQRD
jgi:predicted ester cyclase